ncbi:MdtL family multidrug efflux MFS transporter [Serratia sp. Lou2A]|uniref:MdtL family multidrug efflux MFS transporter n=1 Tax=Serratia montpellierensis TaxID=2598730 RepID=A0ABS8J5D3_9GAMM|nr:MULTISPECIES: MdtL family multidrug efflux MFS transporter [unclassified Serratia (in: enterobacteria)]MCC7583506.1 MdtL family multidrug efflux MFS transporter [Serratia sp. Lou2A]MCC7659224.1 MdtL family multidrug efflux MFS transporter [Serratia sp. Pon4B]
MRKCLTCCLMLILIYPLGVDLYLVGLPDIARDLNASAVDLHTAFSIYLAGMASTMIIAGIVSDRFGRKPIALLGALIFSCASYGAALTITAEQFLFARFWQGVGAGFCYVVTFAILRDALDDDKRSKVLSVINGITCIVPVIAPVLGYLLLMNFKWPSLFTGMAIFAGISCFVCLVWLDETYHKNKDAHQATDRSGESLLSSLFLSRLFITCLSITAILTYVNTSPIILINQMGFSTAQYSISMAVLASFSMATSFLMPYLLSWLGQTRVLFLSQMLFLVCACVFFFTQALYLSTYLNLVGFAMIGVSFAMGFGVLMSQALKQFKQNAGLASSVLAICQIAFSAGYIWTMGMLGVSAVNMLIILLVFSSIANAIILIAVPNEQRSLQV